jgi:hypothetical protein
MFQGVIAAHTSEPQNPRQKIKNIPNTCRPMPPYVSQATTSHSRPNMAAHYVMRLSLGSSASRKPSPIRLMASTDSKIVMPGMVMIHQALLM